MIAPNEAAALYNAVMLHFNKEADFDGFKYNWKTRTPNEASFKKNPEYWSFVKLAKAYPSKDELLKFLVANAVAHNGYLPKARDLNQSGAAAYKDYLRRIQSLTYIFKQDLETILDCTDGNPDILFMKVKNAWYGMFCLVKNEDISLETFIILDAIFGFTDRWNKDEDFMDDYVWVEFYQMMVKYRPFVTFETEKMENLMKDFMKSSLTEA